jgi:anti-anti-sigma factor
MQVKIDTKEKFSVLQPLASHINDNMADELAALCLNYLNKNIKNVILNLKEIFIIDINAANIIIRVQQIFYKKNASFIICELKPNIKEIMEKSKFSEFFNYTPTESEASDIIQMEEIERELLGNYEGNTGTNQ